MIYIFLALIFYTTAIIFGSLASRNANTNLVTAIMNILSAAIPIVIIVPILNKKLLTNSTFGVLMAVVAGIAIALFTMAVNKSYSINKVGIVAPIVFGGSIFLSAILSYLIFKEKVTFIQLIGLIFLGIGLSFVIYARATGK